MITFRYRVADFQLDDVSAAPSVLDAAEILARYYDFAKHPYFVWANAPTTQLEEFRATQAPYLHYVEQFSRSLAAVLARTSTMESRLGTVFENVAEEHGHGRSEQTHRTTYEGYLRAIGVRDQAIQASPPPRYHVAAQALLDFCLANSVEMGAAAVGMVEYTHIKIARLLAQTIHERFWGDLQAQYHYRFHAEIDSDHALSLFALCHDAWNERRMRQRIAFAMAFSVQVWWSQFDTLCPARQIDPSPTDGIRELLNPESAKNVLLAVDQVRGTCDLPVRVRQGNDSWREARATEIGDCGLVLRGIEAPLLDADLEIELRPAEGKHLVIGGRVRSKAKETGEFCVEFMADGDGPRAEIRHVTRALVAPEKPSNIERSAENRPLIGACDHVGIRVTDIERARSFYNLFGFRDDPDDTWEEHCALGLVNASGFRINLIYNAVPRPPKSNILMDQPEKWAGLTHLALSVDDLDEVMGFLTKHRITITEGPVVLGTQRRICFIRDPDDNVIEFTERWSQKSRE